MAGGIFPKLWHHNLAHPIVGILWGQASVPKQSNKQSRPETTEFGHSSAKLTCGNTASIAWRLKCILNFVVYNPITLLKMREAVGEEIGANCDLSHLFWQGCNPVEAIHFFESRK